MRGVDLSRYRFNTDLTFTVLTMHPDGTIYHRYGDRDHRSASVWLSLPSLEAVLRGSLEDHAEYAKAPSPPVLEPTVVLEEVPAFAAKDKGNCIHCHNVLTALAVEKREAGTWRGAVDVWNYPPAGRVGLDLDKDDQALVTSVEAGSAADAAGIASGDRVLSIGSQRILSAADVAAVLHEASFEPTRLDVRYSRDGVESSTALELGEDWKVGTPLDYSWRPFKWDLRPRPGFGGEDLQAAEKEELGLEPDDFAFLVTYIVDWGDNKRFGAAVKKSGLKKRDVVVAVGGRSDFAGEPHFQAWFRMSHEVGDTVPFEYLRDGKRGTANLVIVE